MKAGRTSVCIFCADQNPHRDRSIGITNYTDGLIAALRSATSLSLTALASASSYAPDFQEVEVQRIPLRTDSPVGRLLVDHLHPLCVPRAADLWHYPKGFLPMLARVRQPVIGTVHDVILQYSADHYPGTRSAAAFAYWLGVLKRSISRCDLILTMSKFSEAAIQAFCERHRLNCPPLRVTYEGIRLETAPQPNPAKEDYVLHLASVQPHKRTSTLLELWQQLEQVRSNLPQLRLVGSLTKDDRERANRLTTAQLRGQLSRAELETEISHARALLISSEIEGFGLPALEAYALGTAVVFVRQTAIEEILGNDAPAGFLLHEFDSFRYAVDEALGLSAETIRARAKVLADRFSWERCAELTLSAYNECL